MLVDIPHVIGIPVRSPQGHRQTINHLALIAMSSAHRFVADDTVILPLLLLSDFLGVVFAGRHDLVGPFDPVRIATRQPHPPSPGQVLDKEALRRVPRAARTSPHRAESLGLVEIEDVHRRFTNRSRTRWVHACFQQCQDVVLHDGWGFESRRWKRVECDHATRAHRVVDLRVDCQRIEEAFQFALSVPTGCDRVPADHIGAEQVGKSKR